MMKIMLEKWDRHQYKLREKLKTGLAFNTCSYEDLVKLSFETIFNSDDSSRNLCVDDLTIIDNGSYQGTLLFLIPFDTYQPCEYDYLMTYIGYGSCSICDVLQSLQVEWGEKLSEQQVSGFMGICKDLITNAIRPYNKAWRHSSDYDEI